MAFIVTITEVKEVEKKQQERYAELRREYISIVDYQTLDRDERRNWKSIDDGNQYERVVNGYPGTVTVIEEVKTKLFEQSVSELDMASVIKAINKL